MHYTDDAYAAMLLTMALSPNREEYARPYSVQEFRRLEAAVRGSDYRALGRLLNADISGLMMRLGLSEEESYRVYTLLNRTVQLSYALEGLERAGIEAVTLYDAEYPKRVPRRMGASAPPFFYRAGDPGLLERPAIAIVGISGVKTTGEVREAIEALVRGAARMGYAVVTGGELGVSRVAAGLVAQHGGALVDVLGGGMKEHLGDEGIAALVAAGRGCVLSLEHPEAMFTVSHAIARNKLLFALSEAVFVFNSDGRRGETDALHNRYCDWIYAWEGHPGSRALIARGARPLGDLRGFDLEAQSRHWRGASAEQMNMFDLLN